jgi:hypothetical protein
MKKDTYFIKKVMVLSRYFKSRGSPYISDCPQSGKCNTELCIRHGETCSHRNSNPQARAAVYNKHAWGWETEELQFDSQQEQNIVLSFQNVHISPRAYAASDSMGTKVLTPGVKQSRHETEHLLHLVPRLKVTTAIPPLPPYAFMACMGTLTSQDPSLQCEHQRTQNTKKNKYHGAFNGQKNLFSFMYEHLPHLTLYSV